MLYDSKVSSILILATSFLLNRKCTKANPSSSKSAQNQNSIISSECVSLMPWASQPFFLKVGVVLRRKSENYERDAGGGTRKEFNFGLTH